MASTKPKKQAGAGEKRLVKKVNFAYLHRLSAGVSLLGFFVVIAAGIEAEARCMTIVSRAFLVILAVAFVTKVIVRVLAGYEEINSGQA